MNPEFLFVATNGDVYFSDLGNNRPLYKRQGGPDGVQSNFSSFGNLFCHDNDRYIFAVTPSGVKTLDTETDQIADVPVGWPTPPDPNTGQICYIDGWLWFHAKYNDGGYLVDPTSGGFTAVGGYAQSSYSERYFVGAAKNTKGDYILFQTYRGNTLNWYNVGPVLATDAVVLDSGTVNGYSWDYQNSGANAFVQLANFENHLFYCKDAKLVIIDCDELANPTEVLLGGLDVSSSNAHHFRIDHETFSEGFGLTGVRATGVLVQE